MLRRRPALAAALLALLLVAGACTADEPLTLAPPTTPAPTTTTTTAPPRADRWKVRVAWVRPEVNEAVLHPSPPGDEGTARTASALSDVERQRRAAEHRTVASREVAAPADLDAQAALARQRAAGLTPIPSPGLDWGSAFVDGTWRFQNPTLIGSPLVFLVVEDRGDWLRVMFPARPNQQTAWIAREDVTIRTHDWHIEIDVRTNRMKVWQGDHLEVDIAVVAGSEWTPTPLGRFYLNEKQQQPNPWGPYGTWILATNGFSDSLERFGGEVPMFALHGTPQPETMGMDISNGCIRMPNDIATWMAEHVPVGTPVDIVG